MRALTVRQPYASRIVTGFKLIENRPRPTRIRGRVHIHAAAQLHVGIRTKEIPDPMAWPRSIERLPRSAFLGHVQIVGCHDAATCGDKCVDRGGIRATDGELNDMSTVWHWELAEPVDFVTPIPRVRGALGFWTIEEQHEHLVSTATYEARKR